MIHIKKTYLTVLMMVTFIGCTEVFIPDIDPDTKALVVEGLITDGEGPFTVKLTEALPYVSDSASVTKYVSDAELTVQDGEDHIYSLTYEGKGKYVLPTSFKAKVGNSYILHIKTSDGNIYESKAQTLLPPQSYDSVHSSLIKKEYLDEDNVLNDIDCFDVRVDLFQSVSSSTPTPLCRFESNIVVQYSYTYWPKADPVTDSVPPWCIPVFGWKTSLLDDNENLTIERSKMSTPVIKNHFLCDVPLGISNYGIETDGSNSLVYYYRFNQYTINEETYDYYKEANSQLAASGKLFDPIASQLDGNMTCVNDPSKVVLGLFEVSSVTRAAFVLVENRYYHKANIRAVPYVDIPASGFFCYKVNLDETIADSVANLPDYQVIPYPSWWDHQ